ncbi:MAG: hypothetical protein DRN00_00010 [Thermoplasmata archaeon]|nr:MAG: hypothetical protein DRN03_00090 [Thermoplasmata archaeon]RLF40164.1 MAG: hypothetical protein DRN00_00010 [Thermoplasmata archaeon]
MGVLLHRIEAVIHHNVLDFLEKNKQLDLLRIAEKDGLKGVKECLNNEGFSLNIIERWYLINEEKDLERLVTKAKNLAEDLKAF